MAIPESPGTPWTPATISPERPLPPPPTPNRPIVTMIEVRAPGVVARKVFNPTSYRDTSLLRGSAARIPHEPGVDGEAPAEVENDGGSRLWNFPLDTSRRFYATAPQYPCDPSYHRTSPLSLQTSPRRCYVEHYARHVMQPPVLTVHVPSAAGVHMPDQQPPLAVHPAAGAAEGTPRLRAAPTRHHKPAACTMATAGVIPSGFSSAPTPPTFNAWMASAVQKRRPAPRRHCERERTQKDRVADAPQQDDPQRYQQAQRMAAKKAAACKAARQARDEAKWKAMIEAPPSQRYPHVDGCRLAWVQPPTTYRVPPRVPWVFPVAMAPPNR